MADVSVIDFGDGVQRNIKDTTARTSKADLESIANIENGDAATHQYAVNDHFFRNGVFCTAKTVIYVNNVLTKDVNYTEGQLSEWLGIPASIVPTSLGGTGNADGYIRTGAASGTNIGSRTTIEGVNNIATSQNAHAEGHSNTISKEGGHAEGFGNNVSGQWAHAQNFQNTVSATGASAAGYRNTAGYQYQFVIGQYNNNKSTDIFEVGNGTSSTTSNALELDSSGNLTVAGTITDGNGNNLSALASYLEQTVTLSTSADTTVTFTDAKITATSFIEYACSQWDLVPESITGAAGSCTIVLPKVDSAQSVTVRIYVR